jgi:kinesin family member 21
MSKSLPGITDQAETQQERSERENENESESESDTESDDKATELQAEINDIQSDIEIKTKLIEQLELSQQRMMIMKQHYEEKLNVLSAKITNTQKERDQVLANMGRKYFLFFYIFFFTIIRWHFFWALIFFLFLINFFF